MDTDYVGSVECHGESVHYYLAASENPEFGKVYGILVRLGADECSIQDIGSDRTTILDLAISLVFNSVTPVTVKDVIEDWLLR